MRDDGMNDSPDSSEEMVIDDSSPANQEEVESLATSDDPQSVQKRLGMQAKKHKRQLRAMEEKLSQMEHLVQNQNSYQNQYIPSSTDEFGGLNQDTGSDDDRIQRAVTQALQAQQQQANQAKQAEQQAYVQKRYHDLERQLDDTSDKYDDFDEVVRSGDAPFTEAMRDALLLVDDPGEVAYKLGKNRDELSRISRLHPLDQAREVNKLALALKIPTLNKGGSSERTISGDPLLARHPRGSNQVNDSTSVGAIKQMMRSGSWK